MINAKEEYQRWLDNVHDPEIYKELLSIQHNDEEILDRFYKYIDFGTAGLRGKMGAGTNFMNIYIVRRTSLAISKYMKDKGMKSVAISYDSRNNSRYFALEASKIFAKNGIIAYLFKEIMPTPALSYAVRHLRCDIGIMVTASHNPAIYNGYKVYGSDGCQVTSQTADDIKEYVDREGLFGIRGLHFEDAIAEGKIRWIRHEVVDLFMEHVSHVRTNRRSLKRLTVVYTPLNGAGWKLVPRALENAGVCDLYFVPNQDYPDGNFPTCPKPNPEVREALLEGLQVCKEYDADILIATDPDCDRVGTAVKHKGQYVLITGNEMGCLLLNYILEQRKQDDALPANPIAVKTIVTSELTRKICEKYGVELKNVLTGFKYIGEIITDLEKEWKRNDFIFGFEESYGYLAGTFVRDKEAVSTSLLIAEMTEYYKTFNKTLIDALEDLYVEFGCYKHRMLDFYFEGAEGEKQMKELLEYFRTHNFKEIIGYKVVSKLDYLSGINNLPKADVLEFNLEGGNQLIIRPSGTEPKIKVYLTAVGSEKEAERLLDRFSNWLNAKL